MLLDGFATRFNDAVAFPPEWATIDAHREALNPVPVYQAQKNIHTFTQPFVLKNFTGLSRDAGFFAEMLTTEPEIYGYACSPLDNSEVDSITLPGSEVLARFKNRRLDFNIVDSECSDAAPLLRNWHGQRLPYPPSLSWVLTLAPTRTYFHYDPPYGDCFMFLWQGRKLWLFISPQDIAMIEQRHGFEILNTLPLPDLIKLDNGYLRGRIHLGEMGGGDLMYFPQGWAHYVLTSEDSFGYGGYFGGQEQDLPCAKPHRKLPCADENASRRLGTRDTDQDGKGRWSYEAILDRYRVKCRMLKIHPRSIFPDPSDYRTRRGWISPVMDEILKGMRNGDRACAWIAIELIEEDAGFAFGSIMKANAARELKRFDLDETQKQRIRACVLDMLQRQFMPHEFKHYIRLVLRIRTGPYFSEYEALRMSPHRWVCWFAAIALGENPGRKPESDWCLRRYGACD